MHRHRHFACTSKALTCVYMGTFGLFKGPDSGNDDLADVHMGTERLFKGPDMHRHFA